MVARGLCVSREKAKRAIMAGLVKVNRQPARKPGDRVKESDELQHAAPEKFVSRGGFKLEAALRQFQMDVRGLTAIDVGASTGGVTHFPFPAGAGPGFCPGDGRGPHPHELPPGPPGVWLLEKNKPPGGAGP